MTEKQEKTTQVVATETKVFTFNPSNQPIRVETIGGEPWFVAKDVCDALSLTDVSMTMSRLDDDEKLTQTLLVSGQGRQMWLVNESGLYNLIFQSRKAEAKAFRKWVTSEVLPTIRKTGRYEMNKAAAAKPRVYCRRGELVTAELMNLLWLIGESLEYGDQKAVAVELGVSRNAVNGTLNGKIRSSRILRALYAKALAHRENFMLYNHPDVMAARLAGGDSSLISCQLPTAHTPVCHGLPGCQNGKKCHRKERKGGAR